MLNVWLFQRHHARVVTITYITRGFGTSVVPRQNENEVVWESQVVQGVNPVTFAARSFRPRQGARCFRTGTSAYPARGSVRSEQRRLGRKEPPPEGLRRIWPGASLLVGHSPTGGGCSLLAPRPRPNWAQQTSSHLRPGPLSRNDAVEAGERGRLDRSRRRPADEPFALVLAHQTVSGICHTKCSARRPTERPGRSRSPFSTASFRSVPFALWVFAA